MGDEIAAKNSYSLTNRYILSLLKFIRQTNTACHVAEKLESTESPEDFPVLENILTVTKS